MLGSPIISKVIAISDHFPFRSDSESSMLHTCSSSEVVYNNLQLAFFHTCLHRYLVVIQSARYTIYQDTIDITNAISLSTITSIICSIASEMSNRQVFSSKSFSSGGKWLSIRKVNRIKKIKTIGWSKVYQEWGNGCLGSYTVLLLKARKY